MNALKKLWHIYIYIHIYVYINIGKLLSHKKEWIWVRSIEMDEPKAYYTEWSKSEREKQISYTNTYIWNLEKRYWWTYLHGSNRDVDMENGLVVTVGEGEGGLNWYSSIKTYTLPYVKQIASGNLLYDAGSSIWCSVTT